ncbi:radical SAM protein [Klebsiella sp. DNRA6]|uniref:radical SAM protein n=1 Tax=Klebsiella sp. DNRA6 TaxID=2723057 RepID=UPI00147403DB|nr:radical SAM protein [Klebsiella sp. DNRA6]NMD81429.1 radical SAM protein [Klebsiella sp. DNRA6]
MASNQSYMKSYRDVLYESKNRHKDAYSQINDGFWKGKNAFSHRFDNFRSMVRADNIPARFDNDTSLKMKSKEINDNNNVALYFGVPWCVQTCSYCSLASSRNPSSEEKKDYIATILKEVSNLKSSGIENKKIASAYFGGGTPSILEAEMLKSFLERSLDNFDLSGKSIITLEASPATLSRGKVNSVKHIVNRISLGVQTTDTDLRQKEGRILPREKLLERIGLALNSFGMVNADVLYGMPGQDFKHIYETLKDLINLEVPSITFYRYELFPNTKSYQRALTEAWPSVQEKNARQMYFFGKILLESAGYIESPLGWFIKNTTIKPVISWTQMVAGWGNVVPYFGFGVGAFSTSKNYWMQNCEDIETWSRRVNDGKSAVNKIYQLNGKEIFMVKFMRHIRVYNKIDTNFLMSQSGVPSELIDELLKNLLSQRIISVDENEIILTDAGCSLIHWVIDSFCKVITNKKDVIGDKPINIKW